MAAFPVAVSLVAVFLVGRHAAADDRHVDPLVAAALASRHPEHGGAHRSGRPPAGQDGNVGWPAPPPSEGDRVGWPGGAAGEPAPGEGAPDEGDTDEGDTGEGDSGEDDLGEGDPVPDEQPGPAARRGWRRLFGRAA